MTRIRPVLALVVGMMLLTGCRDDSPIVAAEVQAREATPRSLNADQIRVLNLWLEEHRSGWSRLVLATPPPGTLSVTVHRQNGESGRIEFYSQEGWKGALTYWRSGAKDNWQGSFGVDSVNMLRGELEQ
jgi:hypothetical protein